MSSLSSSLFAHFRSLLSSIVSVLLSFASYTHQYSLFINFYSISFYLSINISIVSFTYSQIYHFIYSHIHTFAHSVIPGLTRLLTDDKFSPNMFVVSGRSGKVKIFDFRNTNRPIFEFYFFVFLLYFFFPLSSSFY